MRHEEDLARADRKKRGEATEDDQLVSKTARDLQDEWKKEAAEFKLRDRLTEADKNNDERSCNRVLDRPLRLVVRQKYGEEFVWDIPTAVRREGETLRQTAERALKGGVEVFTLLSRNDI